MKLSACVIWLWRVSHGFRTLMLIRSMIGVIRVALSLAFVWVSMHLVNLVTGQEQGNLYGSIIWLILCVLFQLLTSILGSRLDVKTDMDMKIGLKQKLFKHIMTSRWMGHESLHTGDVQNRLSEDVNVISYTLCRVIPSVMVTSVQLVSAFVFLLILDSRLAVVLVFIMPVALLASKSYMKRMRRFTKEIRETDSRVQMHLQENLQHRILVATLENSQNVSNRLSNLLDELRIRTMKRLTYSLFSRSVVQLGFSAGYITAFLWGILGLREGAVTFGMMTAFLQLVSQVQRPVVELSRQIPSFVNTSTAVERLQDIIDMPLEAQGAQIKLVGTIGVKFENVTFSYLDGKRLIFKDFSYNFVPGSLTAIVGETGVGKSTLIRLILALLLPQKGNVLLYNENREVVASPLTRCNVIYVPQGNTLMSGTVRENLLQGKLDATEKELRKALYTSVADFVYDLPDGLDTLCGESGAGLSEGQAQRIAIARGLLRPGGILLLDEPTSSIDEETEAIMLQRLKEEVTNKTLLLVTHRERIATMCSDIIKLKKE